jgi:hypothetical protein
LRSVGGIVRGHDGRIIYHPAIKNNSSAIPQPTEWQRIGNQINAAMISTRSEFVNVSCASHRPVVGSSNWLGLKCEGTTKRQLFSIISG